MALSNECNWTSNNCHHHVYNFTNITEKSKMEGRQSRFLGLILGMDPMSMLRASGKIAKPFDHGPHYDHIQYRGGTRERDPKIKEKTNLENTNSPKCYLGSQYTIAKVLRRRMPKLFPKCDLIFCSSSKQQRILN